MSGLAMCSSGRQARPSRQSPRRAERPDQREPKERSDWPSDAKGGGEAADQGRQAEGPSRPASPEATTSPLGRLRRPTGVTAARQSRSGGPSPTSFFVKDKGQAEPKGPFRQKLPPRYRLKTVICPPQKAGCRSGQ